MGKARPITIKTRSFAKAGDASAFFSAMLARYPIGAQVSPIDQDDLLALLDRHDERDEKIGLGIVSFTVERAPPPYEGQRCFWIIRNDLSRVDFSYQHCLKPKPYD